MLSSQGQITPFGLPQMLLVAPVLAGGVLFMVFALRNLALAPSGPVRTGGVAVAVLCAVVVGMQALVPSFWPGAGTWMLLSFVLCLAAGVPIALRWRSARRSTSRSTRRCRWWSIRSRWRRAPTISCCWRSRSSCWPAC